ncbi:MAG: hypothetical protein R3E83_13835 [Burkholderiaceae bacterium]
MSQLQTGTELSLTVRTADQTRRAAIEISADQTAAQVIQSAADNWALPTDTDYTLVNVTTGQALSPTARIGDSVRAGDMLEVQPVLVAGR